MGTAHPSSRQIVACDIGGTHARFALASIACGQVVGLDEPVKFNTSEHASFQTAWEEYGRRIGRELPDELAISFAGPVGGDLLKLTNNPWVIRPARMKDKLGVGRFRIVNDFGAIGFAVGELGADQFLHVCGPDLPVPSEGITTIIGPGTGLGVAQLLKRDGHMHIIETEGGHVDFAPLDALEDRILSHLREGFRRVSIERIVSGSGLANIHSALAAIEGRTVTARSDKDLWEVALDGSDSLAAAALDRFCLSLGAVAGDLALAHGASGVVLAGGVGWRLQNHIQGSGFSERFVAKGRFERRMEMLPVKLITHPHPGLLGAAVAFADQFG